MSREDTHKDFNHLIGRYLSGEMTPGEKASFEEQLRKDPDLKELVDEYRKVLDSVDSLAQSASYDLDAEWELLRPMLPGYGTEKVKQLPGRTRTLTYYAYRIAAVLILGLVLGFSWLYVSRMAGMERVVAREEPVEIMLDDGSQVTVNRNSTLRYKRKFLDGERQVFLSGEAWFEVARDTTRPFVIDAGEALVEVLGTSFNVNAYKENPVVEITVETGLVALSSKNDQKELIIMKAGTAGTYHKKQKELTLLASSDPNNLSWKTRELYFDASSLQEVADLVNQVYGSYLVISNPDLATCEITVTFKNQSLEAVLKVLKETLDLQISHSGHEIRLDGEGCDE